MTTKDIQMTETIARRFNELSWHDSKLVALSFYRVDAEEQVKLSLELIDANGVLEAKYLTFRSSTYLKLEIDLDGKRLCSDDISIAECLTSSEWIRELSAANRHDSFEGYLHFEIVMIPPGGRINILAKDFELTERLDNIE